MAREDLKVGQRLTLRSFKRVVFHPELSAEYTFKMKKGYSMVVVLMGEQADNAPPNKQVHVNAIMNRMGWKWMGKPQPVQKEKSCRKPKRKSSVSRKRSATGSR